MNKEEFITQLRENLIGLPKEDIEERVSFYSEMIDDRIEDGKTEDEAINDLGGVDGVVSDIAGDTKLFSLVKEKIKPKRKLKGWEIALICATSIFWFPIAFAGVIIFFVMYFILWLLDLIVYVIDISFLAAAGGGLVAFFASIFSGSPRIELFGASLACAGLTILCLFGAIYFTKFSVFVTKKSLIAIKTLFIRGIN